MNDAKLKFNRFADAPASFEWRILTVLILLSGCLIITQKAWHGVHSTQYDKWTVGDWLINYHGGFLRRGLIGSICISLSDATHLPLRTILATLIVTSYAGGFILLSLLVVQAKHLKNTHLLLLISPFGLLWPLWHGVVAHRKEVMLLVIASSIPIISFSRLNTYLKILLWSLLFLTLTLIHDGLFFFLPGLVFCLWSVNGMRFPLRHTPQLLIAPAATTLIVSFVYTRQADLDLVVRAVAERTHGTWIISSNPQSDAIAFLRGGIRDGVELVLRYNLTLVFLSQCLAGVLAAIPVVSTIYATCQKERSAITRGLIATVAPVVVLSVVAIDWTRWLYILTSVLTIAVLAHTESQRTFADPQTV